MILLLNFSLLVELIFIFLRKSFNGNFKKVPSLKLNILEPPLCKPITLKVFRSNIGEPEEP